VQCLVALGVPWLQEATGEVDLVDLLDVKILRESHSVLSYENHLRKINTNIRTHI